MTEHTTNTAGSRSTIGFGCSARARRLYKPRPGHPDDLLQSFMRGVDPVEVARERRNWLRRKTSDAYVDGRIVRVPREREQLGIAR